MIKKEKDLKNLCRKRKQQVLNNFNISKQKAGITHSDQDLTLVHIENINQIQRIINNRKNLMIVNEQTDKCTVALNDVNKTFLFSNTEGDLSDSGIILSNKKDDFQNEEKEKCIHNLTILIKNILSQDHFQNGLEEKIKEEITKVTDSVLREKELNEIKSQFVSFACHELRSHLMCVLSSSSLIEKYNKPGQAEQRLRHIKRISSSVKNITDILNVILTHKESESKDREIINTRFDFPEFIGTITEEISGTLTEKSQQIFYHHSGEKMVEMPAKILRSVVLNLLSNASKYSPEKKDITLTSLVTGNRMVITVNDHGIGIPEEDQKKLFTQFFRAGNAENIQGTGLGLCIVKNYVELINGKIDFISKPDTGTTFRVEIPCK